MEFLWAMKRTEVLIPAIIWRNLKTSERSRAQKIRLSTCMKYPE